MENEQKYLKIGEISKQTGVAVSALRYYEEIKLILNERAKSKSPCPLVREIANQKIQSLETKINELRELENEIKKHILDCRGSKDTSPDSEEICDLICQAKV